MKQTLKYLLPFFLLLPAFAFGQVVKTAAVPYTKGTSPYTPNIASSSEIRIDTATSQLYWWDRNNLTWRIFRPGIDIITGGVAPAYTPRDNQSLFAINADAELWYYDGASWAQIVGAGGAPVNIYTADGLLKAGGTEVGLDSGSLRLIMATDAAATKYGLEIIASNATSANRFLSGRTESDSFRIQESGGDYFFIVSTDLQLNISDQLRFLADSVQYFEGVIQTSTALPYLHGNTSGGWVKRFAASGNSGKALVSDGTNWVLTTVVTSPDGNGIYSGDGTVPDGTNATLSGSLEFAGGDLSSYTVTTGTGTGGEYFQNKTGATVLHRDTSGSSSLEFTGTGAEFTFTDGSTDRLTIDGRDARYANDYSATYSDRSLVDKGYIDGKVSIPQSEIAFGNATSDGLDSSPDLTFLEGDAMYIVDAGIDMNNGYLDIENSTGNAFLSVSTTDASSTTGGGQIIMRSTDGAANASGDRLGAVYFRGQTGVGGVNDGATIESFCSNAWGAGDAPGNLVFSVTPDNTTTPANYFLINNTGATRMHAYGDGTFAGTPTYAAGWDANGNFVEFSATAGGISLGSANQVFGMNSGGTANEYKTISGTSNRITVTHGANSITLNAPQDIHTAATPTFSDLTLTDDLFVNDDISMTGGTYQTFTMSGSAANIVQMNGAAVFNVGNATADPQFYVSGQYGGISLQPTITDNTLILQKFGASGTSPQDGQNIYLEINDGAALTNGHYLASLYFRSRGVSSAIQTGGQISALADGSDWTNTSLPTRIALSVCANGSSVLAAGLTLRQNRQVELNAYGSGTFAGTPTYTLAVTSTGQVIERAIGMDEVNVPATIRLTLSAKQNNWNPTGFSTTKTQTIRIKADNSFRFVTGLEAATRDGVQKTFVNDSTNCFGFAKLHTDSDADNRFKNEIIVLPGMSVTFVYDSVAQKWNLTSSTKNDVVFSNWKEDDFKMNGLFAAPTPFYQFVAHGGSFNKTSAGSTAPSGYTRLISGSAATAWPTITTHSGIMYLATNKTYISQFVRISIPTLSTAAEDFDVRFGFEETVDTTISTGIYVNYQREENSGGWTLKTHSGSTTTTNAGSAIVAGQWYNLELIYYPYGEAVLFVDGVRYSSTSTLLTGNRILPMLQLDKDNGTTSVEVYFSQLKQQSVYVSD